MKRYSFGETAIKENDSSFMNVDSQAIEKYNLNLLTALAESLRQVTSLFEKGLGMLVEKKPKTDQNYLLSELATVVIGR